jgi:hypothetical protein
MYISEGDGISHQIRLTYEADHQQELDVSNAFWSVNWKRVDEEESDEEEILHTTTQVWSTTHGDQQRLFEIQKNVTLGFESTCAPAEAQTLLWQCLDCVAISSSIE